MSKGAPLPARGGGAGAGRSETLAFNTFVWKVASRCNLNCSYCYVYNAGDSSWRRQPPFMSQAVALRAAERIREYCERRDMGYVIINFHGGEPLLGGREHLAMLSETLKAVFAGSKTFVSTSIQSNGLLFNSAIGDLLLEQGIGLFISLDGPPAQNDRYRIDQGGRPTGSVVEDRLKLITSERYRPIFAGFLGVVDVDSDPKEVLDYLLSFRPDVVEFLLPLHNYDKPPTGDEGRYGAWLAACFDHWFSLDTTTRIRSFDSIILNICGSKATPEGGLGFADAVVVETNGEIEADDTLKMTFDGGARLSYNVFDHSFHEVESDPLISGFQRGLSGLASECRNCPLVDACGGGHISHRYSAKTGFANPSVYCRDLQTLILRIRERLVGELKDLRPTV